MYLSKLSIHGFKSFAAATELQFNPGITAIVGPNGTGKSNIVDALRWVIGEQRVRILRSDKMNSIIFNGSEKRRPLGMAEVELTIENSRQILPIEFTVVTLGRRVYRSGEAEYLLNGTPCRLRDIQDMFLDTGMGAGAYSVIELKMIDDILSDKAQDRRRLFEEAAGLTKYKQRRSQAIRKLEITQADLARVFDLTDEISKRVSGLKRQATTAARYRKYQKRAQALEYTLLKLECAGLESEAAAIASQLQVSEDELVGWVSRTSVDEAAVQSLRSALITAEHSAGTNQEALNDHHAQIAKTDATLTLTREKLSVIQRDLARLSNEKAEDKSRAKALDKQSRRLRDELKEAAERAEQASEALAGTESRMQSTRHQLQARQEALRQQRSERQQFSDTLIEYRRKLDQCESRITWLTDERSRLADQAKTHVTDLEAIQLRLAKATAERDELEQVLQGAATDLEAAERTHTEFSGAISDLSERLNGVGRDKAVRTTEIQLLESLIQSREDFPDGVRYLVEEGAAGPIRTVSDVITCSPEHRAMLAAALGEFGACIIVSSRKEALEVIDTLKANSQGRAHLVMLDEVGQEPTASEPSRHSGQRLRDVIEVQSQDCVPLIDVLLRNIYCVDTLDQVDSLPQSRSAQAARYVTPTGEWLDERGFMHGGSLATLAVQTHLDRRDTLKKSKQELTELEATGHKLDLDRAELEKALANLNLAVLAKAVHSAEIQLQSAQHTTRRLSDEQTLHVQQQDQVHQQLKRISDELDSQESDRQQLQRLLDSAETDDARAKASVEEADEVLVHLQQKAQQAQDEFAAKSVDAVAAKTQCNALQRDLDRIDTSKSELDHKKEKRKQERMLLDVRQATLTQEIEELKRSLKTKRSQHSGLEDTVRVDKDRIMQLRVKLKDLEDRLRKLRREREVAQSKVTKYQMQQVAVETRLNEVVRRVEASEPVEAVVEEQMTEEAMREEIDSLNRRMQSMGRVNALALEEYEEEKKRLEFITDQCTDLQDAETTLNQTIAEINVTAKRRFEGVMDVIRENFQELFEELFGAGATCDVVLSDSGNVLESPIEIMAKPRGKRPISISQLSSGEKTLTAIALLFAIYMVKPSPFCFLDEVDAPLDDANIDRYMRLIRRFAEDTQFVLVTHNKRTMEMADRLYGVTMQEQGVSSMVGVQFEEALAYASP